MSLSRLLAKLPSPANTGILVLIISQQAFADDLLPDVTIYPPPKSLEAVIDRPQILDEDDLTVAHERSIADVLQGEAGVGTNKAGGFGLIGTVFVRGVGGQGLVTLDDMPLLFSVPGFLNLDTLPTEALEAAELERGPSAVYHSFQSLGGAIRLYTLDRDQSGGEVSVEGGSFGILRETLQGGINGSLGRMTATLSRADAFDGAHFADSDQNPEREPSHFTQGVMRFSSDPSESLNWQGSMVYRNSKVGIDGFGVDNLGRVVLQDYTNSAAREEYWMAQSHVNLKVASNWNSRLQLGFTQLRTALNAGPLLNGVFTRLYLADWRNQHKLIDDADQNRQWTITWGGQGRQEQGQAATVSFSDERTMASGYVDTQIQYGKLSGEAGVRIEHFDQYGDQPLFKTTAVWQITPNLNLRTSGGTGYRLPSYTELLFLFFGNPNLKPERSASGDLAIEWQPVRGMQLGISGFYVRYDDLIMPAYDSHRGFIAVNIADAAVAGMELTAQYAWTDTVETGVSYTYNDSRDLNNDQSLPLRPDHNARIWGQQKLQQLPITLWAEALIRSSTWSDTAHTVSLGESVQVNASIRYALASKAELYLRGENLTNNRTPQFFSADMPGIAVYGGIKLEF